MIGREAGWILYGIVGFFPVLICGSPWILGLMPEGPFDLTTRGLYASWLPWKYHAAVFVSLMVNATILAVVLDGVRFLVANFRKKR